MNKWIMFSVALSLCGFALNTEAGEKVREAQTQPNNLFIGIHDLRTDLDCYDAPNVKLEIWCYCG